MTEQEKIALFEATGEYVREQVEAALTPLNKRLEEIERNGIKFMGSYQRAINYPRGSMTVDGGSLWAAVRDVDAGERPGSSDGWQLAAKAGRDGKDGR